MYRFVVCDTNVKSISNILPSQLHFYVRIARTIGDNKIFSGLPGVESPISYDDDYSLTTYMYDRIHSLFS